MATLANYLHKYSLYYVEVASPLSNLLKKDAEWCWNTEHHEDLKPLRRVSFSRKFWPDLDRLFSVVCDASDFSIGSALLQVDSEGRERVIAFESRQIKAAEKNYPVHDKEILAMNYALVKFRVHLLGSKLFFWDLSGRLGRWDAEVAYSSPVWEALWEQSREELRDPLIDLWRNLVIQLRHHESVSALAVVHSPPQMFHQRSLVLESL
ncbi:unnamed protein product [Peronospora belbahrii]|uniref:Reverse transcriptase/retrotransposon-derived protein RNase H-like domain-containing protein n=1 Tax=Peronospora belbahrii TaxID=622444 RepID=A0AAU9KQP1_9STRA|nr:unnamed protein product [Peronospora belbahrii]